VAHAGGFLLSDQLLVSAIPVAGPLVLMVLRPVFTVGFLAAAWTQERGGKPEIRHLFRGFGSNLWALLPVGIVLIVGLTWRCCRRPWWMAACCSTPSPRTRFATSPSPPTRASKARCWSASCRPVHDPCDMVRAALIVFQDCGPWQAMQLSLRAALANWRPVAVYGLLLFFCGGVVRGLPWLSSS
jgi:hypothetical protein